jgi:putative DNA primase/helicase
MTDEHPFGDHDEWMASVMANGPTLPPALNQDALALVFTARHRTKLRYCHHHGSWFVWTGSYWRKEETKLAFCWAREICREFNVENSAEIAKVSTASGVERYCQADRAFAVTSEIWDRDPFLLGTPGGTVDLRSGELRPPKAEDMISRLTAVTPAPPLTRPKRWLKFLKEATGNDTQLIRFLQHMAGYALTGDTREHALFFGYGDGGTGKSTFVNTLNWLFGDYAVTAPMETFTVSHNERHPTDLAMLRGARLVTAQETEAGRAWAESRIKALTGGDRISARFMRQDFFTYQPIFKLLFVGNHRPVLRNVDDAARRRFKIIPFTHKPAKPDLTLPDKIRAEAPAILRWCIDGALGWSANGLGCPATVNDATTSYFESQDVFGAWLAERCRIIPDLMTSEPLKRLFKDWSEYADAMGDPVGTSRSLGDRLEQRGFPRKHTESGTAIRGLYLKPPENSSRTSWAEGT